MSTNAVKYMKATGSLKQSGAYKKDEELKERILFIVLFTILCTASVFSILFMKG